MERPSVTGAIEVFLSERHMCVCVFVCAIREGREKEMDGHKERPTVRGSHLTDVCNVRAHTHTHRRVKLLFLGRDVLIKQASFDPAPLYGQE